MPCICVSTAAVVWFVGAPVKSEKDGRQASLEVDVRACAQVKVFSKNEKQSATLS